MLPVGAIYLSVDDADPAVSLGYGTWVRIANGRMLVAVDEGDVDFAASGSVGGQKTVTPSGTVSAPTFTGDALGSHSHAVGTIAPSAHSGSAVAAHASHTHGVGTLDAAAASAGTPAGTNSAPTFTGAAMATHSHQLPLTGIGGTTPRTTASFGTSGGTVAGVRSLTNAASTTAVARELTQAVTAGTPSGTVSAPTFTGTAMATHDHALSGSTGNESASLAHSVTQPSDHTMSGSSAAASAGTPAGSVSAPSFTGASHTNLPPYFAVFMFRRAA